MNHSPNSKFYSLRIKTDRELAILIGKTLDRGLTAANELALDDAEKAYGQAHAWVPLAAHRERSRLEGRLDQLRQMLDEAAAGHVRVQTACG